MFKKNKGLSLIEMIVVIAIITIFAGMISMDYLGARKRALFFEVVKGAITDLREVQSKALSGADLKDININGYGICFEKERYFIFNDKKNNNNDKEYDGENSGEKVKEKKLPSGIEATSNLDVFFEPPLGKIYVDNNSLVSPQGQKIVFEYIPDPTYRKEITIYPNGLIE